MSQVFCPKSIAPLYNLSISFNDTQVLKVIRYSTKLALATALKNDSSDLAQRLKEFEGSIGTSRCTLLLTSPLHQLAQKHCYPYSYCCLPAFRKAYRLGKWLSDLNTLRNTPVLTKAGSLEVLASGGEGVYYFVEQLTWYAPLLLLVLLPLLVCQTPCYRA